MAAIKIACGTFHWQVGEPQFFVNGDLGPNSSVARVFGRALFPGVVAKFAFLWNRVKNPKALSGAYVKATDVAFVVAHAARRHTFTKCRADNDRIPGNDRCRLDADFTGDQVRENILVIVEFEIYNAVFSKRTDGLASFCIQTNQPVTRRDVENSFFFSITPVGEAAAGELPRSRSATLAFMFAVNPKQFASARIESNDGAARASRCV